MKYTRNSVRELSDGELHAEYERMANEHQRLLDEEGTWYGPSDRRQYDALATELILRARKRWGRGAAVSADSHHYLRLLPGSPAALEHGELTGLRLDGIDCDPRPAVENRRRADRNRRLFPS